MGVSDDEHYSCPDPDCSETFTNSIARGQHISATHDSADIALAEIQRVARLVDGTPTTDQMDEHGRMSAVTAAKHLGSWNNAIREAGCEPNNVRDLTKQDVIDELQAVTRDLGHAPMAVDMEQHGSFSHEPPIRMFGSWDVALDAAGLGRPPRERRGQTNPIQKDEIISELERISDIVDRTPHTTDMEQHGSFSVEPVIRRFGSWDDALESAGFDITTPLVNKNKLNYGPGWADRRIQIRARDNNLCRVCGKSDIEITHTSVNVHHITPARGFGAHKDDVDTDYEQMNDPSNLICLCPSCHAQLEGKFQDATPDEFAELGREYLGIDEQTVVEADAEPVQTTLGSASD